MAAIAEPTELQQLLKDLEQRKEAYDQAFRTSSKSESIVSPAKWPSIGRSTLDSASPFTGDQSDDEEDQSLYAQDALPQENYGDEGLQEHLRSYTWDEDGRKVVRSFAGARTGPESEPLILPQKGSLHDRSHHTHFQIFDVGNDGALLPIEAKHEKVTNRPAALWQTIKSINPESRQRKAVGRLNIVREPAPILFGALHYTMNKHFDVDELFGHLVSTTSTWCSFDRAFHADPRRQSSFAFVFEYFILIGKDCQPMAWQMADSHRSRDPEHVAITRCSSVVALSLKGKAIDKMRNPDRRAGSTHGYAYDPWSPYHVLNIQCFPDWESSMDVHGSNQHYVNGVEAFPVTLLAEYKDAEKRFDDIYKQIARLVTPPLAFMFESDIRDKLLFEDDKYTYSRRYFWAFQTLGIMIDSMNAMVDAYEDNFTDEVWEGQHRTLWPLLEQESARNKYYKKKLAVVRMKFARQGTSVMEARKSVQQAEITVQQGYNIKLLTLVNLFFLPLTFVASVFGMEILPDREPLWRFAAVTVAICLPCFILVDSLNSRAGLHWWRSKCYAVWNSLRRMRPGSHSSNDDDDSPAFSRATRIVAPNHCQRIPSAKRHLNAREDGEATAQTFVQQEC
ncbi:hypothetical protein TI39_contig293g00003 [Zymoseptoria brevis]|uniref:Mg2+ transporter zinc transport protein n=1 Tax=Zymoseptoria brevis TaxID=1047168 RepID=A0A0F4GVB1_9PEZI|nr:hypothetical protein TI39_contig293g00003 [Zymoseptoria brevis]